MSRAPIVGVSDIGPEEIDGELLIGLSGKN